MDAIELLRKDHQLVLGLLERLEDGRAPADRGSEEAQRARKELVTELVVAESQHEAVEEQFFWPAVREDVPGGEDLAAQALEQEEGAKQLLDALDKAQPAQADFEDLLQRVIHEGRQHIAYEQDVVWPRVQESLSKDQLADMGNKMAKAKKNAPTRPHPAAPSTPAAQKTAGPLAALLDKARDAMSGRRKR
ncbi:hemerythrin HHE cation binding domain-containing protein [Prauserella shujinwangii]|uniref:Hemerythrin HHE cation binding domain-containing protein n=1 Tax=Prauserella shujinwangii TaxID=1453103 RepID=A0A2T0M198_9PSEU|nr:hemerythrin domain-containing protein [Prauserella shujinwangii]PRX50379.1 hemerythrin HHE cation binding domain-containing protein [Prauserella shujinwangii]